MVAQGESGRAYILTDREGERTILVAPNTNDDLKEVDIPWEALAGSPYLHLRAFGRGPLQVQQRIAGRVPDTVRPSLDPGEWYARLGGRPWKISWTIWRPCWSRKPSGGCWGKNRKCTPTGPRPWW